MLKTRSVKIVPAIKVGGQEEGRRKEKEIIVQSASLLIPEKCWNKPSAL